MIFVNNFILYLNNSDENVILHYFVLVNYIYIFII